MPSDSKDLNIKYGKKTGTGTTLKSGTDIAVTPGNIYAAENSLGEIEMYMDTPQISTINASSERKRLDPRIYVGPAPQNKSPQDIFDNYDVWIDTSGDPVNVPTAEDISNINLALNTMKSGYGNNQLKIRIIDQTSWNTWSANQNNDNSNTLSIILPAPGSGESSINKVIDLTGWSTSFTAIPAANADSEGF